MAALITLSLWMYTMNRCSFFLARTALLAALGLALAATANAQFMGADGKRKFPVDVERGTLLSMVGQGFGVTIVGAATSLLRTSDVTFLPVADEPEPVPFSAVWSPFNCSAALRNLLTLAREMGRTIPAD